MSNIALMVGSGEQRPEEREEEQVEEEARVAAGRGVASSLAPFP